jgi:hypothetical protein
MVTAETAVVLPACALFVAAAVWIVSLGHAQVRLVDAARDTARLVARGVPAEQAERDVRRTAPADATFSVRRDDGFVVVRVRQLHKSPLPGLAWPLSAEAVCVDEQ